MEEAICEIASRSEFVTELVLRMIGSEAGWSGSDTLEEELAELAISFPISGGDMAVVPGRYVRSELMKIHVKGAYYNNAGIVLVIYPMTGVLYSSYGL